MHRDKDEQRFRAEELVALERVAAAAGEADAAEILAVAAQEAARLSAVEAALVARFQDDAAVVVAAHRHLCPPGAMIALGAHGALARVAATGGPARVDDYEALPPGDPAANESPAGGRGSAAAAPIRVGGRLWGAILVARDRAGGVPAGAERRLGAFAGLIAAAIAYADDMARVGARSERDPLTGLANHRSFQGRLHAEVASARRARRPLALVLFDLDHFRQVNEAHGHDIGDRVLTETARRLGMVARSADLLARIGGEEFAWLMPGADELSAWEAAERGRAAIAAFPFPGVGRLSVSAGICELAHARDAEDLHRLAAGALYWAKLLGRDAAVRYTPEVDEALSADERAQRLQRSRALVVLRLLARVVDARDHSTREHSERVADLAVRLATALDWAPEDRLALSEAGLVHDVGKVGVPDRILFKPGRLTRGEYEQVKAHAALGAQIVADALRADQVSWVRNHHERYDGRGYPDGLAGEEIPFGARILAVADAWDVMTGARRLYSTPMHPEAAIEECRREAGRQFCPHVVAALVTLWEAGALARPDGVG